MASRPSAKSSLDQSVSPRKQQHSRLVSSPKSQSRSPVSTIASGTTASYGHDSTAASALLFVSTFNSNRGHEGNPHVQAIQSRVADLVRRYDESVSDSDGTPLDDDDGHIDMPSRWKVGDVLMATHNALAKTGTRTERTIIAEFRDDPEVIEALGNGERNFARVVEEAAQQTQQLHQMFEKTLAIVKQLQRTDEELRLHESRTAGEQWQQVRELKITIEALQKEKSMVLGQLQEQLKTHKELLVAMDEQNQELKKTQIAMTMKADEMKILRDDFERRVAEAQRALDTSQQSVSMWREKFQASTKTLVAADQKVAEMEKKIQSQAEEIIKHEVVFQAKAQEEKHKEKVKDGEVQRLHGEVAAAMQKIAELEDGKARKNENSDQVRASLAKEKQELLNKLEQAESTIRELQARLSDELSSKNQFQNDNNELSRLVLEMKDRAREVMNKVPPMGPMPGRSGGALLKKATSFAMSLRALSIMGSESKLQSSDEDDGLSTSSDDDDSEIGKEDIELSATVQQVVTSAFPQHQRVVDQSDENIVQNIARYEDPKNTPMNSENALWKKSRDAALLQAVVPTTSVPSVPMTEVECMKLACDEELARMKKQYVQGLIEYKRLVIEQYERRQSQIREYHRAEIESMIVLVQEKFKREIEKHGENMLRAKESLKLLYRAMKMDGNPLFDRLSSVPSAAEEAPKAPEEAVPLKSLLRAAVFAMSNSKKRNNVATKQINDIYNTAKEKKEKDAFNRQATCGLSRSNSPPLSAVPSTTVIQTTKTTPAIEERPPTRERHPALLLHVGCQVCEEDFDLLNFAKGFRNSSILPKNMDDFVLSSSGCFGNRNRAGSERKKHRALTTERGVNGNYAGVMLHLVEGEAFSGEIVAELREMLPNLPAGAYYLSAALRQKILFELLKFYSSWDPRFQDRSSPRGTRAEMVEVIIGSPRDTPFMRRKALESIEKQQVRQRRRQLLSSGGEAIMQSSAASYVALNQGSLLPSSPRSHDR